MALIMNTCTLALLAMAIITCFICSSEIKCKTKTQISKFSIFFAVAFSYWLHI